MNFINRLALKILQLHLSMKYLPVLKDYVQLIAFLICEKTEI